MLILILMVLFIFLIAYYAYTNAININYKIHNNKEYSQKEYKDDKMLGGICFGIIVLVIIGFMYLIGSK